MKTKDQLIAENDERMRRILAKYTSGSLTAEKLTSFCSEIYEVGVQAGIDICQFHVAETFNSISETSRERSI